MKVKIIGPYPAEHPKNLYRKDGQTWAPCHECGQRRRRDPHPPVPIAGIYIDAENIPVGPDEEGAVQAQVHFVCGHNSPAILE